MGFMDKMVIHALKMASKKMAPSIDKHLSGSKYIVNCPYCGVSNGIVDNPSVLICHKCKKYSIFDPNEKLRYICKCVKTNEAWKGLHDEIEYCDICNSNSIETSNIETASGMKIITRWK